MDLCDIEKRNLSTALYNKILSGRVPDTFDFVLKSRVFEKEVGKAVVFIYDSYNKIAGCVVHAKPVAGYHYKSGRDVQDPSKPLINIDIDFLDHQAHNWETLIREDIRREGYGTLAMIAAIRLSQQEGAKHITAYASANSENLASTNLARKLEAEGLRYCLVKEFPSDFDDKGVARNSGTLFAFNIADNELVLKKTEQELIEKLFY
jgi:RimJ/RimL family protein N-acetyltransferase